MPHATAKQEYAPNQIVPYGDLYGSVRRRLRTTPRRLPGPSGRLTEEDGISPWRPQNTATEH